MRDVGYCIGVDVCPDRREEEQAQYEYEQIAQGKAVRCSVCGDLVYRRQSGFDAKLCTPCAREDVRKIKKLLRRYESTLKGKDKELISMLSCFLLEEFEVNPQEKYIDISECLKGYLQQ